VRQATRDTHRPPASYPWEGTFIVCIIYLVFTILHVTYILRIVLSVYIFTPLTLESKIR
jgi:hypothetical protein